MFEIIDAFVTNILTAMVYSVPVWTMLAFVHFVARRPVPQRVAHSSSEPISNLQVVTEPAAESTAQTV